MMLMSKLSFLVELKFRICCRQNIFLGALKMKTIERKMQTQPNIIKSWVQLYWSYSDWGDKTPRSIFVKSPNVWISCPNFLAFSFNPFATQFLNFKTIPSTRIKIWNLNQDHPSKKSVQILTKLSSDNLSHKNVRVTKFWSLYQNQSLFFEFQLRKWHFLQLCTKK